MRRSWIATIATVTLSTIAAGACTSGGSTATPATSGPSTKSVKLVIDPRDGGRYAPQLDPADFVAEVDNPYFPLPSGATWTYEGKEAGSTERVDVKVLAERRRVLGIPAAVVRDTVTVDGKLAEDTFDYYAQDRDGNVWYLGESTKEYDNGKVTSTAGTWVAGVNGAYPGIVMQAAPKVGDAYRQEYLKGEAEDVAEVVRVGVPERVPAGSFQDLITIKEQNPLKPKVLEEKYYAAGVGPVLEVVTRGGTGRVELIRSSLAR